MNERLDPIRILVLGDSLCFHGPDARLRTDDERMFPNVMARDLGVMSGRHAEAVVVARSGWNTRDLWELVTKDVWLQERLLPDADVVVLHGVGADALPVGVPTWAKDLIPRVPNPALRKRLRRLYARHHAGLVRLSAGRMRMVPRRVTLDLWPRLVDMVRFYSGAATVIACGCPPTSGLLHGRVDPHSGAATDDLRRLAAAKEVPFVDPQALCDVAAYNPDGIHWDYESHRRVGQALADAAYRSLAAAPEIPIAGH
ncbi:MAG: SGNH/GDSL hydrolase family protein [Acidimicrobiia bacterium]